MAGPTACDPELSIASSELWAASYGYLTLVPTGGTGAYRFELITDGSGAIVNELTGAYLAGPETDTVDVVRVTDLGCTDVIDVTIQVATDPVVMPPSIQLPLEACFTFEVTGGSGQYTFTNVSTNPVGQLKDDGSYQAAKIAGTDLLRVEDAFTGLAVDVEVTVGPTAGLNGPGNQIVVPIGSQFTAAMAGGSGTYDMELQGEALTHTDGSVAPAETKRPIELVAPREQGHCRGRLLSRSVFAVQPR